MQRRDPFLLLLLAGVLLSCGGRPPVSSSEVSVVRRASLPVDPSDAVWDDAPTYRAELIVQDLVEPRLLEPSTARVDVRAVSDGRQLALRLRWEDATRDDLPGASRFSDACAVQLPRDAAADVPAPQMGEPDRAVEIAYWRASWQAAVDGRPDDIRALYPGAAVDHYPFEAPSLEPHSEEQRALASQYAPARALGNFMEGRPASAVQDLLAEGPGTLSPAPDQRSQGAGRRLDGAWEVVIVRPLPSWLEPGQRTQVAFAVWDGEHDEVGARKMRSVWVPLHLQHGEKERRG